MMSPRRQLIWILGALFLIVAIGVIGYTTIEGWSLLDSFYMTVITLSTVGYKEVYELSTAGRVFSIILIIGGVGTMFYTLTTIVQYIIEGRFGNILGRRSRMKERISELQGHVILCGYGQVGREVVSENSVVSAKQIAEQALIAPARCCLKDIGQVGAPGETTDGKMVEKVQTTGIEERLVEEAIASFSPP